MARFMTSGETVTDRSLCEVDFFVIKELTTMDYDDSWETLAISAGYNFTEIRGLKQARYRSDGPTSALLYSLGCQGYTVKDLYEKLEQMRRKREMDILEDYVRRNNEPPLGRRPTDSGQASKKLVDEDKENKKVGGATAKDRDSFFSQIKIPGFVAAGSSVSSTSLDSASSGSGVNFNQLSSAKAQHTSDLRPGSKNYLDKLIPGAEQLEGADSVFGYPSTQSGNSSHPIGKRHQPTETEDNCTDNLISPTPSSVGPSVSQVGSVSSSAGEIAMSLKTSFSYRELSQATKNFSEENLIGEGAFGKVYKGTLKHLDFAIKRLNTTEVDHETNMTQAMQELSLLLEFPHENIVVLYGYALDGKEPCLVYQHLANGSLEDRLALKKGTPPLKWERRLNIVVGACKGLNFLHKFRGDKPLIHGDIKSANILLDQNLEAKLADLGQAQYAAGASTDTRGYTHVSVVQTKTKLFGTKAYHAPEVLNSGQISMKSDVYAMGVVFLEVCSGLKAYDPNRGMMHFLADSFKDLEEEEWTDIFQDRNLKQIPLVSLKDLLYVAFDCVQDLKKKRPKTDKLLGRVKDCYESFLQLPQEKASLASCSGADAGNAAFSKDLMRKVSEISIGGNTSASPVPFSPHTEVSGISYQGPQHVGQITTDIRNRPPGVDSTQPRPKNFHTGLPPQSNVCMKQDLGGNTVPGSYNLQGIDQIAQEQQAACHQQPQYGQELPQAYPTGAVPPCPSHIVPPQRNGGSPGTKPTVGQPVSSAEPINFSSMEANYGDSLEANYGDSIPLRLQRLHDQRLERERLRQEGLEDPACATDDEEQFSLQLEELRRQKKLVETSAEHLGEPALKEAPRPHQPGLEEEEDFPKADPQKLRQLLAFDSSNNGGAGDGVNLSGQEDLGPVVMQCDPKKMAMMQQLDDGCYKTPAVCSTPPFTNLTSSHIQTGHPPALFTSQSNNQTVASRPVPTALPVMPVNGVQQQTFAQARPVQPSHFYHQAPVATATIFSQSHSPVVLNKAMNNGGIRSHSVGEVVGETPYNQWGGQETNSGFVSSGMTNSMGSTPPSHMVSDACYLSDHTRQMMKKKFEKKSGLDDLMAGIGGGF